MGTVAGVTVIPILWFTGEKDTVIKLENEDTE